MGDCRGGMFRLSLQALINIGNKLYVSKRSTTTGG